jgi:integrase/recombinase XerD
MKIEEAITLFGYHQRSNQKTRTIQSYRPLLQKIQDQFAGRCFDSIGSDEIYRFLKAITDGQAKSTRRLRFAQFKAFYNFLIEKADLNMRNPCDTPILAKAFRAPKQVARRILDRETVEEFIYNAENLRDRLILELQARCGLRIGESLKITVKDSRTASWSCVGQNQGRNRKWPSCRNRSRNDSTIISNKKTCPRRTGYSRSATPPPGQR